MLTVLVGLSSAVSYATSDMLSQKMVRTVGVTRVLALMLPVGLMILLPLVVLIDGLPAGSAEWQTVAYSAVAGVIYLMSFLMVYAALKVGDLCLVAPLASLATLFVAVFALLSGERPTGGRYRPGRHRRPSRLSAGSREIDGGCRAGAARCRPVGGLG